MAALWDFDTCMVYGIYGSLGGGKSLTAVEMMIDALNHGHKVVSNIQLFNLGEQSSRLYTYMPEIMECDFKKDLPVGAPRGSLYKDKVLIVIDEMAECFDQFSTERARHFMTWARHSSKLGQIPVFIVQNPEYLAKSIRLLVYRWIFSEDMKTFRMPVLRCRLPFVKNYCRRVLFDKRFNQISRSIWNFVDKRGYGKYYNTAQLVGLGLSSDGFVPSIQDSQFDFFRFSLVVCCLSLLAVVLFY